MGNSNTGYPTSLPYPYNATAQNIQPNNAFVGVGMTTPQVLAQNSYAPGIANAGYYNDFDACCGCGPTYQPAVGLPGGGYGINPAFTQNNSADACCGPNQQIYVVQTQVKTTQPISNIPTMPMITPIQNQVAQVSEVTQVITPMRNSFVSQPAVITPVIPVSSTSVGASLISQQNIHIIPIDPTTKLTPRALAIIQKLSNVNPLRGSVVNRLQAPQYITQKQAYYQGQWVNGYMSGFGKLFFDNGGYFEGQFIQGNAQTSNGLFIYPDGSYYLGGVIRNCANGQGIFNYRNNKLVYKGKFLNDQPDGYGTQSYSDGSSYEGQFRAGKKEGRGKFTWTDGTVYQGQFQNGFMQGQGVHKLSRGDLYEGQFRKNKRHGKGRLTTPLGIYFGNFRKDTKQGHGQFTWTDGRTFKGTFKSGKPDGPGVMTLTTGQTVYGLWVNGVVDTNSLSLTNNFGSSLDLRGSVVSNASMGSVVLNPGFARGSVITNGPPILNLPGGIISQGFTGMNTPTPFRSSTISVIGPGSYNPRLSSFGMGLSNMGVVGVPQPKLNLPYNPRTSSTAIIVPPRIV